MKSILIFKLIFLTLFMLFPNSAFSVSTKKENVTFETYTKKNITIHYRGNKKYIEPLAEDLIQFQNQTRAQFFDSTISPIINIYLYRNQKEYQQKRKLQKETYAHFELSSNEIFSYIDSGNGPLFHEIIHLWLSQQTNSISRVLWFEEGLASYFESPEKDSAGNFQYKQINWRMESIKGKWTHLGSFIKTIDLRENHSKAQARIVFLWLAKQNLLIDFVKKYFENLDFDTSGTDALLEVTGKQIDELDAEIKKFKEELESLNSPASTK